LTVLTESPGIRRSLGIETFIAGLECVTRRAPPASTPSSWVGPSHLLISSEDHPENDKASKGNLESVGGFSFEVFSWLASISISRV